MALLPEIAMARQRVHGDRSLLTKPHPTQRYADRIQLIRWRRGPGNPTWEARVRLPDGAWTRPFSLGTDDEVTAALNAVEELTKREQLQANGLPQPTRKPPTPRARPTQTFGEAAQQAIKRLNELREQTLSVEGRQKAHKYVQHIQRINSVLLPAFADKTVTDISRSFLNDWMRGYRTAKGDPVVQNTVGNYNNSFQIVMSVAVERGWIRSEDVPSISKRGFKTGTERAWFTVEEMEALRDHMTPEWVQHPPKGISSEIRYLLRAYVALGSCTGIRPGLEMERIRANQVLFEKEGSAQVIRIPILRDQAKAKKSRDVYVFENDVFDARKVLRELIEWRKGRGIALGAYLFSRPSDGRVPNFSRPFKQLLIETGLLVDPETQQERVPYSLRHYFATRALLRGNQDYIVAQWMGTSPAMIDKHYSKVKLRMKAAELAGTADKLARIQAAIRRQDAELRTEPAILDDEDAVSGLGEMWPEGPTQEES